MANARRASVAVSLLILLWAGSVEGQGFVRGDCNADGKLNIADPISELAFLFPPVAPPAPLLCEDACDINDDGQLNIGDPIYSLNNLFSNGPPPPEPSSCGPDATDTDPLTCASFPPCGGLPLSHATDIQPIWDANCTVCHGGSFPFGGLDLSGNAYDDLVGVMSGGCSSFDLVLPFNPDGSWVYRKVAGTHTDPDVQAQGCVPPGTGSQMPIGASCCLDQGIIDLIAAWIAEGAAE